MQNAVAVGVGDRSGDLRRQPESFLGRYRSAERVAVQILHDQEVNAILIADVVQGADVRMIQPGDRTSFLLEALACLRIIGHVRGQDLDRDRTIEPGVSRFVDLTHPTSPDARPNQVRTDTVSLEASRDAGRVQRLGRRRGRGALRALMRVEQEFHLLSHRRIFAARFRDVRASRISRQRHCGLKYFAHARPVVGNGRHCLEMM